MATRDVYAAAIKPKNAAPTSRATSITFAGTRVCTYTTHASATTRLASTRARTPASDDLVLQVVEVGGVPPPPPLHHRGRALECQVRTAHPLTLSSLLLQHKTERPPLLIPFSSNDG